MKQIGAGRGGGWIAELAAKPSAERFGTSWLKKGERVIKDRRKGRRKKKVLTLLMKNKAGGIGKRLEIVPSLPDLQAAAAV